MMVKRGYIVIDAKSYLFLNPLIDKKSMYSRSMKIFRVTKRVLNLNIKRPRSFRTIAIQVCPIVVDTLLQPPTLQTVTQLIETMAIVDTVSIGVQVLIVMMNKKIFL